MTIRITQICLYFIFCTLLRIGPWRYFQLNAKYFNHNKGIFSKLDMDQLIPPNWRLSQWVDHPAIIPETYPVFLKPEWGQNSKGIQRADNLRMFKQLRLLKPHSSVQYLVQQGAQQNGEFEVFLIPQPAHCMPTISPTDTSNELVGTLSITQVINRSNEQYPINGIYNSATEYVDVSDQLSVQEKQKLYALLRTLGPFNICRIGLRANSLDDVLAGKFHIIEINLFFPMPLILLCKNVSLIKKYQFMIRNMWLLAKVTKAMPKDQPFKDIFFKKLSFFYQVKDFKQKESNECQR